MRANIKTHFQQQDPLLWAVLEQIKEPQDLRRSDDLFSDLCDAIISQQLSNKVAAVLVERCKKLFGGTFVPERILSLPEEEIRAQGISFAKIRSLKDLSARIVRGDLSLEALCELPNEEIISRLVEVKGIGPWTAEMFLMFSLGCEDVFSAGDGGLKRAIKQLYNFEREPTRDEMLALSQKWIPFRTYACRILWNSLDAH